MAANHERKFEEELADLEALVSRIDSGELSLEDSITAFERGVALVRALNQKLDEVERRVEVLTRGPQGQLRTAPYQGDSVARDLPEEPGGDDEDPY